MFFSEEYNKENVARLSKKMADLGSFNVCYETDPENQFYCRLLEFVPNLLFSRCISLHPIKQCVMNVMQSGLNLF
ncbi:hypothetical protein AB4K20DRAFT_1874076 [Rhizopus microsporus]